MGRSGSASSSVKDWEVEVGRREGGREGEEKGFLTVVTSKIQKESNVSWRTGLS